VLQFVRFNSLSIFFFTLFFAAVVAQSIVGVQVYNEEAAEHGDETISWLRYLWTSHFGEAVLENWQSEWLQFCLFTLATVWLLQEGSPESKQLDKAGLESDEQQRIGTYADAKSPLWARVGGLRTRIYENSLLIAFSIIFFGSWAAQAVTGWTEYNGQQRDHDEAAVSLGTYLTRPDFWEKTLQNWQSEFLAVGTLAVLAIYLRQRGSPESKPVGADNAETGSTG
jgi:hypothetical protein